ncbi:Mu-like prophage DNA circulation protein [Humidesulfovibrio mexicanus]|uniref:Mu-like prophage DNA circulation protein n=1 Tax=Humidesulfovibrio mexicanus TaxID=147047 RepID=A0A239AI77_9BACT|nr:DNA circularization N-terminal domain-containing protein [Humidesulfovibrio mexicanus]SNR95239.1 Mu-like prophage DNA circulation protein [Humidesulfovibrio mexicanus]
MAWKDTLLPASFRGAPFEVLRTRDHGEKAVALHEYPYRDGGEVEDLARKARRISITAVFWGPGYEQALEKLIKALGERGAGELVHPVFGPLKAQAVSWDIPHEGERPDYAEVALEFVEAGADTPFFARTWPMVGAKADTARAGTLGVLEHAVANSKNPGALVRSGLRSLAGLQAQLSGQLLSGYDILSSPAAWAADAASLVRGLADLRSFGAGSLLPDFNGLLASLTAAILLPSFSGSGGGSGGTGTGGVFWTAPGTDEAATPPVQGAELDTAAAHVLAEAAVGLAEAAQTVLEAEAQTPTLSPVEIETVAGNSRELIQTSIDTYRAVYPVEQAHAATEPLKDVALAVQQSAAAVIAARPPLVAHTVAARSCPRLLAHRLYGDHTRALEIQRLNALRDPNFLTPGQELTVYAK